MASFRQTSSLGETADGRIFTRVAMAKGENGRIFTRVAMAEGENGRIFTGVAMAEGTHLRIFTQVLCSQTSSVFRLRWWGLVPCFTTQDANTT